VVARAAAEALPLQVQPCPSFNLQCCSTQLHFPRHRRLTHHSPLISNCADVAAAYHACCDSTSSTSGEAKHSSALATILSATGNLDSSVPVEAAAEAVRETRLHFVVFADMLPALPRERVLSRMRDVLLQLCGDDGGAEATRHTAAIACALCSCRLVFGAQAADAYSTFLSSCVTAAASKGSLLPLLYTMLQLLPSERLLHLQVHQRIMASSIGGKYRSTTHFHFV
jgi:hypothetical protein